jgi:hypothetical protein
LEVDLVRSRVIEVGEEHAGVRSRGQRPAADLGHRDPGVAVPAVLRWRIDGSDADDAGHRRLDGDE